MPREYEYIRGNTVTNPSRDYGIGERKKKSNANSIKKKNKRLQEEKRKRRVGITQIAIVMVVLGFATVWRYGTIYKKQAELSKIRSEIKVSTDLGESIRVDLLKYASLDMIKSKAEGNLGMKPPDKSTTVTVDMKKNYFVNLTDKDVSETKNKSIFSKIKDALVN